MLKKLLENVKMRSPLIHNITNYVTINDVANGIIACGASPIMVDDIEEVEDITKICDGLNINIGTLNSRSVQSMIKAGKKANEVDNAVVMDPVAAGASKYRKDTALMLMEEIDFDVICGNISEIKSLAGVITSQRGVDADSADERYTENIDETIKMAKKLAINTGAIVGITGEIDIITDGKDSYTVKNGDPMMSKVSGTGCLLSGIITAFVAANKDKKLEAVVAAVVMLGLAGEMALARMSKEDGNMSYRNYLIDSIYNMTVEKLEDGGEYEKYS